MRTPAVLYAAKSTQDKHLSIPKQFADGRQKASEEDWEILGEFSDEGFSAYSGNRGPSLKEATDLAALAAAERGTTCMLIAQHSDRFARGAGDKPGAADSVIEVWLRMRRVDVHLRTFQNDSMMGKTVTVAVASEQSYEESKRKSEAVKDGMARRTAKGKPTGGGRRPLGLRHSKEEGYLLVPDEVPIIQRIFAELRAGIPQLKIVQRLEVDKVPTSRGRKWHQGTIATLARNPIYKGMINHNGEVLPGAHEAIIDPALWDEVNAMLTAKAKSSGGGKGRPPKGRHLFRKGMLRCECGASLVPRTNPNRRDKPYEIYRCYGKHQDPTSCSMPPLQRAAIDSAVYNYFEQVALDVDATREQLAGARDQKLTETRALHSQAETERHRAEERLARVRRDYTDGNLDAADWAEFRDEISAELEGARAHVERLSGQITETEQWGVLQDVERDTLAKLAELRRAIAGEIQDAEGVDAVRAALVRLFDGFAVRRVQPGMRVPADLAWQGDYIIEPIVGEEVIQGYSPLRPILRREPIYDAERSMESPSPRHKSFPSAIFGPIPVLSA
jgi:site-specific DNA recombinase